MKGDISMRKALLVVMMILLYGCAYKMSVLVPGKTDLDFAVLVNIRENAVADEKEASYMKKIRNQTEFDMCNRLKDRGVKVRLIKDKSEYTAGEKNYLLQISYVKYIGETISRTLIMHYTLYNDKGVIVFEKDLSAATRRGWTNLISSVNYQAVGHIDRMFAQKSAGSPDRNEQQVQPGVNQSLITELTTTAAEAR